MSRLPNTDMYLETDVNVEKFSKYVLKETKGYMYVHGVSPETTRMLDSIATVLNKCHFRSQNKINMSDTVNIEDAFAKIADADVHQNRLFYIEDKFNSNDSVFSNHASNIVKNANKFYMNAIKENIEKNHIGYANKNFRDLSFHFKLASFIYNENMKEAVKLLNNWSPDRFEFPLKTLEFIKTFDSKTKDLDVIKNPVGPKKLKM